MSQASVKIDDQLKERIERLIKTDLRFRYPTIKHFVDNAVLELLKQLEADAAQEKAEKKAHSDKTHNEKTHNEKTHNEKAHNDKGDGNV